MNIKMIVAAAACVTVAGGGVTGAVVANTPKAVTSNALSGMVEDVLARQEIEPLYNMLKQGSLEASLSSVKSDGVEQLQNASISGKIYFSKDAFMAEDVKVKYGSLNIAGQAYISSDLIYVQEDNVLGDAYGINIKSLAKDLEDSIFAYGSGSKYAIQDEEAYEKLIETLDQSLKFDKMRKDLEKIGKKYVKKIAKIVMNNAEYSSETKNEKLNGTKEKVRVITMEIDGEVMSNIISEVYDFLLEDNSLVKHFEKYEDEYSLVTSSSLGDDKTLAEWYAETLENCEDQIDLLCDSVEESFSDIELEIATPKMQAKALKLTLKMEREELFVLDFGAKGAKKTDKVTLEVDGSKYTYEIKEDTSKKYKAVFECDGEQMASVNVDRKEGEYKLLIGSSYKVEGTLEKKGKNIQLTVDAITDEKLGSQLTTDLTLNIKTKDKMPKAPKDYKTIADITEKDIDKLLGGLDRKF